LIEEVTAHAQSDNLEDAREICADGTYFPNNLRSSDDTNLILMLLYLRRGGVNLLHGRCPCLTVQ